jgi:ubiquinol-cytochrome c reductase cytochrome b subunit
MGAIKRSLDWLDERTGYRGVVRHALDEPVRGGASWAYVFGSVLVFILVNQLVTGVMLAMSYSPSASDAWASVAYIQDQVTMGWFIRGLHGYGASAMVIVCGLHMLQTAVFGAYKRPREVTWIVGVLMMGLVLAFALTGYLLPWDQKGYWATKVATGIMGETPIIGPWLRELVQGGNEYGNLTLTRFYSIHVFVLPGTLILLLVVHVALFRKHGVTPRWGRSDAELDRATQPFWPDQLLRDMVAILVVFGLIWGMTSSTHGVELGAPADPSSQFDARPEWYFLPLFQVLKYFSGTMETVAALGLPLIVGLYLLGLPFLDRKPERSPLARVPVLSGLFVLFIAAGALMWAARSDDAADEQLQKRLEAAEKQAKRARELALQGVPPAGGTAVYENDPLFRAGRLWGERCAGCHAGDDRKAPELTIGYNTRPWIRDFLKDPDGPRFFGPTKIHGMKPTKYEGADLDAIVELVYAQTGAADVNAALSARGQELFDDGPCSDCHSIDWVTEGEEGPNLGRRGSEAWLTAFIAEPGHPRFFGEKNEMPAFKDKLPPDDIALLARWVIALRQAPAEGAGSGGAGSSGGAGGSN